MKFLLILVVFGTLMFPTFGKKFSRCSVAKELHALNVLKTELPQWTCGIMAFSKSTQNIGANHPKFFPTTVAT